MMIEFPCRCGHVFRVEEDQAGGMLQCPQCRRLNDVPAHSDLGNLTDEGIYKIDEPPGAKPYAAADLAYVYQRGANDAHGQGIDLRLTQADINNVGSGEPIPLVSDYVSHDHAPRYDPETGELIQPHELKASDEPQINPGSVPWARPAIGYASGTTARGASFTNGFVQLLTPGNLAVMIAVFFFFHVLTWPLVFVSFVGIGFFDLLIPVFFALVLSHYGNVIEDIGPMEKDELPRPLRDLGWYEDIWSPFVAMFGAMLICYGIWAPLPSIVFDLTGAQWLIVPTAVLIYAAGTFFLPAVMLTLQTSGTIWNLRPDRVLGVISACGPGYLLAVVTWVIATTTYLWGWTGTALALGSLMFSLNTPQWLTSWAFVLPALLVGIFSMHYYCLCLGLIYRAHHAQFPWILQRHIRTEKVTPTALPFRPPPTDPVAPARAEGN